MAAFIVILSIAFGGAHGKLEAKPCDAQTGCLHPAFK